MLTCYWQQQVKVQYAFNTISLSRNARTGNVVHTAKEFMFEYFTEDSVE